MSADQSTPTKLTWERRGEVIAEHLRAAEATRKALGRKPLTQEQRKNIIAHCIKTIEDASKS